MEGYLALIKEQREEYKKLEDKNYELRNQLQQKENIIKEVREYIEETHYYSEVINEEYLLKSELLEILDKENNYENNRFIK